MTLLLAATLTPAPATPPTAPKAAAFGVAAHPHVNIEWWYVNAHVTTAKGRHLAVMGSFFRVGNGVAYLNPLQAQPRAHYLIYEVTDLDAKTQRAYSLADGNMVALLQQLAPFLAAASPKDKAAQALSASLKNGQLPPGNQLIPATASVVNAPFKLAYGPDDTLTGDNAAHTKFTLNLDAGGADKIRLTLDAQKPPMAVGGNGETGLVVKNDMYYYSLTRCGVTGTVDTGAGPEAITGGQGWFDHQWGNSWVAQNDGWDWWGAQLNDGTDILFFRQRNLATGKTFFPLATFMDKEGHETVTRNIVFTPDPGARWTSPQTGVTYPTAWTITFPEKHLTLHIKATVDSQEMPTISPGSSIWEGSCDVTAFADGPRASSKAANLTALVYHGYRYVPSRPCRISIDDGVAYMELVGYNSPAVKALLAKQLAKGR